MSDEEKGAVEKVREVIETDKQRRIETIYDEKPLFREQLQTLLDLIDKQQKEIEEKTTILLAGAEKVKQLEKEIQRLEKDNDTLSELVIVNEDKVIKELDLISKDKIREKIKEYQEKAEDVKQKYKGVYAYKDDYLEALAKIEGYQELLEDK